MGGGQAERGQRKLGVKGLEGAQAEGAQVSWRQETRSRCTSKCHQGEVRTTGGTASNARSSRNTWSPDPGSNPDGRKGDQLRRNLVVVE